MSPSVFKALLQFDQTGALGRGEADQFFHFARVGVQPLQLGERVDHRERGAEVRGIDRAAVEGFPLGDVAGDQPAAVGVPALDE